jgi:sorbitol-specific phosphotransferase system component IIC
MQRLGIGRSSGSTLAEDFVAYCSAQRITSVPWLLALRMYDPMTVETYGRLPENRKPAFLIFMHAMWESGKLS